MNVIQNIKQREEINKEFRNNVRLLRKRWATQRGIAQHLEIKESTLSRLMTRECKIITIEVYNTKLQELIKSL